MLRFVLVLLVCVAIAPLAPWFAERYLEPQTERNTSTQNTTSHELQPDETVGNVHRIKADRRGQYVAQAVLNGRTIDMLVDTGATVTALPEAIANDIGIFLNAPDFKYRVGTANGQTLGARAVIDRLEIGSISLWSVDAIILKDNSLSEPLLGMSALNKLDRFDISSGTLVLVQ